MAADSNHGDVLSYTTTGASNGTLSCSSAGACTYTATTGHADSFTFKANDGTVDSNTATVTINIANVAPVASATTKSAVIGTPLGFNLPATDANGDSLTYTA